MIFFFATLLFTPRTGTSLSTLPLSQRDASDTVGWMPEPDGRGTFSLLLSCLLTLGVCVWSAMHLNIPPHGESSWDCWMRNIRWCLAGVFGPELLIFIAWKQYLSARAIVNKSQHAISTGEQSLCERQTMEKMPEARSKEVSKKATTVPESQAVAWKGVHGFYAGMGGFVFPFDAPRTVQNFTLQSQCHCLTLTARGVALLAECDLLPDIPGEDIIDKSKSDSLTKLLACTQAGWMAVQIIGRLAVKLPVTLLEINTLGHVLCALVIYVLWWHKPRLVQEPTTLKGNWVGPVSAYMYMSSQMSSGATGGTNFLKPSLAVPELCSLAFFQNASHSSSHEDVLGYQNSLADPADFTESDGRNTVQGRPNTVAARTRITSSFNERVEGSFRRHPRQHETEKSQHEEVDRASISDNIDENTNRKTLRWRLAAEAVCRYPAIRRRFQYVDGTDTKKETHCLREVHPEELVAEYSGNWSTRGLLPGVGGLVMGVVLWTASVAFGAIHTAAWNDHFPTSVEAWIWRCCSIWIVFSGLLWSIINLCAKIWKPVDDAWNRMRRSSAPWVSSMTLAIVCAACGAAYAFARMFLVIEAFISLRRLPDAAYETPEWTQLIPHL